MPLIKADVKLFWQLIASILDNAIKFNKSKNPTVEICGEDNEEEVILHFIQNDHGTGGTEGLRYMQEQRNHYDTLWNEISTTLNKMI